MKTDKINHHETDKLEDNKFSCAHQQKDQAHDDNFKLDSGIEVFKQIQHTFSVNSKERKSNATKDPSVHVDLTETWTDEEVDDFSNGDIPFCGFYWIRSSGIAHFKWFSSQCFEERWNQEDLFFTGFLSALSSAAEVFFDGEIVSYIELADYKIYMAPIESGDIFVLISCMNCPDPQAKMLLQKMIDQYYHTVIPKICDSHQFAAEIENHFLQFLDEVKAMQFNDYVESITYTPHQSRIAPKDLKKEILNNPKPQPEQYSDLVEKLDLLNRENKILAGKLNSITSLSRTLGHTFNNILAGILGNLSLAQMEIEDIELLEYLNNAEGACDRAQNISNQLLNFSKQLQSNQNPDFSNIDESLKPRITSRSSSNTLKGTGKILLMDDELDIRESTSRLLEKIGYDVDVVVNGDRAIDLYHIAFIQDHPYDAVILDLSISGGLGGKETLHRLRSEDPNIIAIISSGYANDPIFKNFQDLGFRGAVKKPYNIAELSNLLHKLLKSRTELYC